MNDFLNSSEERLDRQQIFYAVLGELKNILLARVVLRSCTLIRCAVLVLHRELAATVTDAEHCTATLLVSLWSLRSTLGFPYIQLRYPTCL
jgi:hypothetical protein